MPDRCLFDVNVFLHIIFLFKGRVASDIPVIIENHIKMDELIIKYLNKAASEEDKTTLLAWLKADETNREYFLKTQKLWNLSNIHFMPEDEITKALDKVNMNISVIENRRQKNRLLLFRIAAAVIVICMLSVGSFYMGVNFNKYANPEPVTMNQVIMGNGNRGFVTLPDGTVAWLNSGSKLIYPEKFEGKSRSVRLDGEGYFEVKKDEKKPFFVETENMIVNVLGTIFDIQNYTRKPVAETVLMSGKVEVTLKENNKKFILQPDQKISYNKETGQYKLTQVDAEEYAIWTNDKLILDSEKLSKVLRKMEHWYGVTIQTAPNLPLDHRLTLTIRYEPKEEILKMLSLILPIQYTINGDLIEIR